MLLVAMGRLLREFKYHRTNRDLCEDGDLLDENRADTVIGEGNSVYLGVRKSECLRRRRLLAVLVGGADWLKMVCFKLLFHDKHVKWR